MGGIAGAYHLDGQPVNAGAIQRVTAAIAHRGPEGISCWREGPAGLGYAAFNTTPESISERQPLVSACGNFALVFDGRIDNRDELFNLTESRDKSFSDAQLVLSAYRLWADDCPRHLLGDFAFIVWDRLRNQLFCARDPLGIKPLFYHSTARLFQAGSEIQQFFADPEVSHQPNEGMVAEYLACALSTPDETLWKGIYRVLPGHSLTVKNGQVTVRRFYELDAKLEIRYRTDQEYADHFLELLKDAVRCRLRSNTKAGVLLSGGVDSSTVTAVAAGLQPVGLDTFSLIFPGLTCDESDFINEVTTGPNVRSHQIEAKDSPACFYTEQAGRYRDFPDYPNGAMCHSLRRTARKQGCRVVLTGLGGDEWLMGSYYHYADLLRRFRLFEFSRQLRGHARAAEGRFSWRTVLRFGLWPLLPSALQRAGERRMRRNRVPDWINPQLARRTALDERLRTRMETPAFPTLAQRDIHEVLTSPWRVHSLEMEDRAAAFHGVEQRHPLSDRRIVEFALALPEQQRWRDDQTKFVLRESMRGLLPERIRTRRSKAEFSPVFMNLFLEPGAFQSSGLNPEWVDVQNIGEQFRTMESMYRERNPAYTRLTCPLWMVWGMHIWRDAALNGDRTGTLTSSRYPRESVFV